MHKVLVFYTKQHNNEGSVIKFSDNQSPWKVPCMQVNRVFSGLADDK